MLQAYWFSLFEMAGTANADMTGIDMLTLTVRVLSFHLRKNFKIQAGITLEIFVLQYSLLQLL